MIEINEKLIDEPEIVNASLEEGWFYKIKVIDMEGFEDLMTEEEYQASCIEGIKFGRKKEPKPFSRRHIG